MAEHAAALEGPLPAVLDRTFLHVFVLGSGAGEAVLVALPKDGWLVIDGCGPRKALPALELLRRYRAPDEPVDALILTHPHADHYQGIVELLDDAELGKAVRYVGCVAEYLGARRAGARGGSSLDAERSVFERLPPTNDPVLETELGRALSVLSRIQSEWEERPARELQLRHGTSLPLRTNTVTAQVLWPEASAVLRFFAPDEGLRARIAREANRLSAVLDLRFQQTRILLTGDLIHADSTGKALLDEGWGRVNELAPGLNAHHGLKVPHHGSRKALCDELLRPADGYVRTWVMTPFNSRDLPGRERDEGIERLLEEEDEILLTALPVGWRQQSAGQVRLTLPELDREVCSLKGTPALLSGATPAGRQRGVPPVECCWGVSFDGSGRPVSRFRGQGARVILGVRGGPDAQQGRVH